MPGRLRPGFHCPECGRSVLLIFHEWSGTHDTATFEYHHHEDAARERRGDAPVPCVVVLPYDEGLTRYESESR